MKTSEYLYGTSFDASVLRELPYTLALHRKNFWAKELTDQLMDVHYMERDNKRLNDIKKAVDFNDALIAECYGLHIKET